MNNGILFISIFLPIFSAMLTTNTKNIIFFGRYSSGSPFQTRPQLMKEILKQHVKTLQIILITYFFLMTMEDIIAIQLLTF